MGPNARGDADAQAMRAQLEEKLADKLHSKFPSVDKTQIAHHVHIFVAERNNRKITAADLLSLEDEIRAICRPSAQGATDTVPVGLKNDWLILDTYQILETEKLLEREKTQAKNRIVQCKQSLDVQLTENAARALRLQREAVEFGEEQQRLHQQHEREQAAVREKLHKRAMEEKKIRESQMRQNELARREQEAARKAEDERTLLACQRYLHMEQEANAKRKADRRAEIAAMVEASIQDRTAKEELKRREAEEENRRTEEDKRRLERQEKVRADAFAARKKRYEEIGAVWAEKGAGKKQREIDLAQERKVLREAAAKEAADAERERRDKAALLENRRRCHTDNLRLAEEKRLRTAREAAAEEAAAARMAADAAAWALEGRQRQAERKEKMKRYGALLQEHVRMHEAGKKLVLMSDREKAANGPLLRKLQADPELMEKITKRIAEGEPVKKRVNLRHVTANPVPTIGAP